MKIIRKEVRLPDDTVKALQAIADKERRSLKNLMEGILIQYAQDSKKKKVQ